MTALSPIVPNDLANSTIPIEIYELSITNKSDKPRTINALSQSWRTAFAEYFDDATAEQPPPHLFWVPFLIAR
jgi:uncharacterized protein (DUF608 family)